MCVNRAIDDLPGIQQDAICYQWFKQRLMLSVSKPKISQRSQIKEDTVEPSVPAREFNLKAYAAGPQISQNVNYTQRGTMEGQKAPSEARRREAPGCGVWEGRCNFSPVSGGTAPENFKI